MCNCKFKDKRTCAKKVNNNIHDGTKLKFNAFEKYTKSWIEKIINYNKNKKNTLHNINFIDCMASSGLYFDSKHTKDFFEGTAIRIFKIYSYIAKKYQDYQFNIYLNDYDKQYVECLKCIQNHLLYNKPINLNIFITKSDKYEFIDYAIKQKNIVGNDNKSLIIYDPYDIDFNWNHLSRFLKLNADFLITHFFPNDIKRNINTHNPNVVLRYENAYCLKIEEIKIQFEKENDSFKRTLFFRRLLHNNLKKYSNKRHLAYAPVILNKSLHIYDIVCLSHSSFAQELLKNTMYLLYKECNEKKEKSIGVQLALFDDSTENSYENDRASGVSEYQFHYDDAHIFKMFYNEFKGRTIPVDSFKMILREHPYLPTNIMKIIKKFYDYKIEKKQVGNKIEKCYVFPDGGFII